MQRPPPRVVTLVVPVFNEEANLVRFYETTTSVLEDLGQSGAEFVFVDDGSRDGSFQVLESLRENDDRVHALRFPRNFGSHVAIAAGLDHAGGDCAVIIAADLQDPPATIGALLEQWRRGYDVVWAARRTRAESGFRQALGRAFYGLVRRYAIRNYPEGGTGSFCLIDAKVVRTLRRCLERNRLTFGLIAWTGFSHTEVPYDRVAREAGKSGWTTSRLVKAFLDTFISFSSVPIRAISIVGTAVSTLSLLMSGYVFLNWLLLGTRVEGWTSVVVGVFFLGGVQLVMLGILGEYLARVLEEVHGRPLYVVERSLGLVDRRIPT